VIGKFIQKYSWIEHAGMKTPINMQYLRMNKTCDKRKKKEKSALSYGWRSATVTPVIQVLMLCFCSGRSGFCSTSNFA
jgi:hypothetical protein